MGVSLNFILLLSPCSHQKHGRQGLRTLLGRPLGKIACRYVETPAGLKAGEDRRNSYHAIHNTTTPIDGGYRAANRITWKGEKLRGLIWTGFRFRSCYAP